MFGFQLASILVTLAAVFAFVNARWVRLPRTVGVMLLALAASLGLIALGSVWPGLHRGAVGRILSGGGRHAIRRRRWWARE